MPSDIVYSILPYWHSFALTTELISPLLVGGKIALRASAKIFSADFTYFNPSIVFVVPSVVKMFKSNILKKMQSLGEETHSKFNDAYNLAKTLTGDNPEIKSPEVYENLKKSLLNNIKAIFGTNFRFMISGGAPIDINLQRFFELLLLKLCKDMDLLKLHLYFR